MMRNSMIRACSYAFATLLVRYQLVSGVACDFNTYSQSMPVITRNLTLNPCESEVQCGAMCCEYDWCQLVRYDVAKMSCFLSAGNKGGGDGTVRIKQGHIGPLQHWEGYNVKGTNKFPKAWDLRFNANGTIHGTGTAPYCDYVISGCWNGNSVVELMPICTGGQNSGDEYRCELMVDDTMATMTGWWCKPPNCSTADQQFITMSLEMEF